MGRDEVIEHLQARLHELMLKREAMNQQRLIRHMFTPDNHNEGGFVKRVNQVYGVEDIENVFKIKMGVLVRHITECTKPDRKFKR